MLGDGGSTAVSVRHLSQDFLVSLYWMLAFNGRKPNDSRERAAEPEPPTGAGALQCIVFHVTSVLKLRRCGAQSLFLWYADAGVNR